MEKTRDPQDPPGNLCGLMPRKWRVCGTCWMQRERLSNSPRELDSRIFWLIRFLRTFAWIAGKDRGRCPRTPGILRFPPAAWYGSEAMLPRTTASPMPLDGCPPATRAHARGRAACQQSGFPNAVRGVWGPDLPSAATRIESSRRRFRATVVEHLSFMLLVQSVKCRGLGGRAPKRHGSRQKPDEPPF